VVDYGRFTDQWSGLFRRPGTRIPALVAQSLTGIPTRVDYGSAGRYVFGSEFLRSRAAALPFDLPDTAVERAGINPAFFTAHVERPWSWRVLYVGRLHPDKGIHNAVAAMQRLPPQSTLTFAGSWDPRDEQALAENVVRLGLADRVKLLGQLPQGRIAELYREHDVLLFPVLWDEPWGLVPLEAMAAGCPVIATGRGGSGEYLQDESNCVLAPTGSPGALADAVRRLAGDPELRARVRRGGEETARLYTQPRYHARLEHHLAAAARQATVSGAAERVRAPIDADALV
jgi:glycosyltransferase involved in cell wall biosynthesis